MLYNKKLIELSNRCLIDKQIPDIESNCKFSDGKYMSVWFSNNKTNIWNNRKKNPYCLMLIRTILSIDLTYFDKLNTDLENIEGNSKIILKKIN